MKKYKRLTYKSNGIIFSRALNEEEILNRLAELEDKIESEELINFKQAVKNAESVVEENDDNGFDDL